MPKVSGEISPQGAAESLGTQSRMELRSAGGKVKQHPTDSAAKRLHRVSDDPSAHYRTTKLPNYRTCVPWRDVPERFGRSNTVYRRFTRWTVDGT